MNSHPLYTLFKRIFSLLVIIFTLNAPAASISTIIDGSMAQASQVATLNQNITSSGYSQALTWAWKSIEADKANYPVKATNFPKNFLWGVGTSSFQVEGNCDNSSYVQWAKTHPGYQLPGIACDHWNRYKEDIALMKQMGVTTYRFSIEWSKIEPQPGVFNQEAINHYVDVCRELHNQGIRPAIGFHHYSDPQWFLDIGGFEHSSNIHYFVQYTVKVFRALQTALPELFTSKKDAPLLYSFNSANSYASNGYLTGLKPPGKQNMQTMMDVLKNMLDCHVQMYQALKKLPGGANTRIGITHNVYQLDPVNKYNPIHRIKCYFGNKIVHDPIYDFFRTGTMTIWIPCKGYINYTNPKAPRSLDFLGLNYYCHGYMATTQGPLRAHDEIATDNDRYSIYAEGLYRAIKEVSENLTQPRRIPIIITENGIGTNDNAKRELFYKRYLYALSQAINDGYKIDGYITWSFMDNFEWGSYGVQYGLYHVDRATVHPVTGLPTLQRTLKPGARYFVDLIQAHKQLGRIKVE